MSNDESHIVWRPGQLVCSHMPTMLVHLTTAIMTNHYYYRNNSTPYLFIVR
jgi:hypothetical protein